MLIWIFKKTYFLAQIASQTTVPIPVWYKHCLGNCKLYKKNMLLFKLACINAKKQVKLFIVNLR